MAAPAPAPSAAASPSKLSWGGELPDAVVGAIQRLLLGGGAENSGPLRGATRSVEQRAAAATLRLVSRAVRDHLDGTAVHLTLPTAALVGAGSGDAIASAAQRLPSLQRVTAQVENGAALDALSAALPALTQITKLTVECGSSRLLSSSDLGLQPAARFADALHSAPQLQALDFSVLLQYGVFATVADAARASLPALRELRLSDHFHVAQSNAPLQRALVEGAWPQLEELHLTGRLDAMADVLAGTVPLAAPRLRRLHIYESDGPNTHFFGRIVAAAWLAGLEAICVHHHTRFPFSVFRGVALPRLQELEIESSGVDTAGGAHLAAAHLPALTSLCLSRGHEAFPALAAAPWAPQLRALALRSVVDRPAACRALAAAPLAALTRLDIAGGHLATRHATAFTTAAWISSVVELNLTDNPSLFYSGVVPELLQRGRFASLRRLLLDRCLVELRTQCGGEWVATPTGGEAVAVGLANAPWLPQLQLLSLRECAWAPGALAAARRVPAFAAAEAEGRILL